MVFIEISEAKQKKLMSKQQNALKNYKVWRAEKGRRQNQSCLRNGASRETLEQGLPEPPGGGPEHVTVRPPPPQRRAPSSLRTEATVFRPSPCVSPHLAIDVYFKINLLYDKLVIQRANGCPEFWALLQQINYTRGGGCGDPDSQPGRKKAR